MVTSISADRIDELVTSSIKQLCYKDRHLLKHDLNECSINHRLACHLQNHFPDWDVDCEYNKNADKIKELDLPKDKVDWNDTEAKSVFPDVIVHKRGGEGPNLLVIEVKKSTNKLDRKYDYNKLKAYGDTLKYSCALFLEIGTKGRWGTWDLDWIKRNDFEV
ncbi:MAG TPA: hypothetical protein VMW89_14775 [Desulfatiglandales bacterium]|nr:hypothetical protein [Desulfatiglandales bacterium]